MTISDIQVERDKRTVPPEAGDHERLSHYAPTDKIAQAMVERTPVKALCGKIWVPTRDGKSFPVCPECQEAWDRLEQD